MGLQIKRKSLRLLAMVLTLVMVIGLVPAGAASKKSYTAKTVSELIAAAKKSGSGTITLTTASKGTLTIKDSNLTSAEKKRLDHYRCCQVIRRGSKRPQHRNKEYGYKIHCWKEKNCKSAEG